MANDSETYRTYLTEVISEIILIEISFCLKIIPTAQCRCSLNSLPEVSMTDIFLERYMFKNLLFSTDSLIKRSFASQTAASKQLKSILQEQIDGIKKAGTFKNERVITSSQKTQINVSGSDKNILNFCANNYLGLSVIFLSTLSS